MEDRVADRIVVVPRRRGVILLGLVEGDEEEVGGGALISEHASEKWERCRNGGSCVGSKNFLTRIGRMCLERNEMRTLEGLM